MAARSRRAFLVATRMLTIAAILRVYELAGAIESLLHRHGPHLLAAGNRIQGIRFHAHPRRPPSFAFRGAPTEANGSLAEVRARLDALRVHDALALVVHEGAQGGVPSNRWGFR